MGATRLTVEQLALWCRYCRHKYPPTPGVATQKVVGLTEDIRGLTANKWSGLNSVAISQSAAVAKRAENQPPCWCDAAVKTTRLSSFRTFSHSWM